MLIKWVTWMVGVVFLSACSGLADDPQIVATFPPPQPVQRNLGEQVFLDRCSTCHGVDGRGGGAVAVSANLPMPDFRQAEARTAQTFEAWVQTIRDGRIDRMMPPWRDALTAEQIQAVATYTYGMAEQAGVMSVAPVVREIAGRVTGRVINGTAGAAAPDGGLVSLHTLGITGNLIATQDSPLQEGAFVFDNVILSKRHAYVVSMVYDDMAFVSPMHFVEEGVATLEIELVIYEVTTDSSVLSIDLLLNQAFAMGDGRVEFLTVTNFVNRSDRVYRSQERLPDGRFATVHVYVPEGVVPLGIDEARFVWDEQAHRLYDTVPVLPAMPHGIYLAYQLLVSGEVALAWAVDFAMSAPAELMLPPRTFAVGGGQWAAQGEMTFREGVFEDYLAQPLLSGEVLTLMLSPLASVKTSEGVVVAGDAVSLVVVGMGIVFLGIAAGLWWREKRLKHV